MRRRLTSAVVSTALLLSASAAPPVSHDFNNDNKGDYPVSITGFDPVSPRTGAARLWSGASKAVIQTIVPTDANTLFGWSIASAGDVDDDGSDDIAVGEPLHGAGGSMAGRVRVFSGATGAELLSIVGPTSETGLGRYVAGIGDWNGDGTPDIAASGWYIDDMDQDGVGDHPLGVVFIFSGVDGALLADIFDPDASAFFGYSVFGLGDITGDGLADIALVDREAEGIGGATGRIHIFAGTPLPVALTIDDAHRTIVNDDAGIRGFAAQIDVMHPDLWLSEPTLQVISLVYGSSGGVNQAASLIDIYKTDGQITGTKGIRPTLVLAGDVNLDGKVDALDLAESISQLGTDPQALGVMPIADLNDDGLVDVLDVALLLDSYGDETDIYEGLWDGSRLLSVVGGASGFGSVGVGPSGGAWGEAPGPRPSGDCQYATWPPDQGLSLLPALLRADRTINCATCPTCDDPPQECYECDKAGKIVGGEITAVVQNPNPGQAAGQPLPGQTVCFEWEPFSVEGRERKCKPGCGPEGTTCPVELAPGESWVIEKKNATTGAWEVIKSSANGDQSCITGAVCEEYRFRLTSNPIAAVDRCEALAAVQNEEEVQFAEFTLISLCVSDIPANKSRAIVGIGEEIDISVVEQGAGTPRWDVNGEDKGMHPSPYRVTAQESKGVLEIVAEINGCRRKIKLTVIEPEGKNYTVCAATVEHTFGEKDIGVYFKMDLDPDTVSFYAVTVREGAVPASGLTGDYEAIGAPPHSLGPWRYVRPDNTIIARDHVFISFAGSDLSEGSFKWDIPFEYAVAGGTIIHAPEDKFERQVFTMTMHCVQVSKGGFTTPLGCRSDPTIIPSFVNCNINGQ